MKLICISWEAFDDQKSFGENYDDKIDKCMVLALVFEQLKDFLSYW
jgi:hypothetical protein